MKIIQGNIFNTKCQTIVNTVNCVGIMGAGIALEYKLRYPSMFDQYVQYCEQGVIDIGKLWIYKSPDKWVMNFPTKKHWKFPSEIEYLQLGLEKFVSTYKEKGIESIAFPLLGADKGGLDSNVVLELMQEYLGNLDCEIEIYQYDPKCSDELFENFKKQLLSQSDAKQIAKDTKVRIGLVEKLMEAIQSDQYHTISQLQRIPGLGEKSIVKLFEYSRDVANTGSQISLL